jgi:hypothetical protein
MIEEDDDIYFNRLQREGLQNLFSILPAKKQQVQNQTEKYINR